VYGPVRTVVWEDGGREAPSYPILDGKGAITSDASLGCPVLGQAYAWVFSYSLSSVAMKLSGL